MRKDRPPIAFFTLRETCDLTGLHLRTLRDWIAKGYVQPAVPAITRGSRTYLNFTDLLEIYLILNTRPLLSMAKIERVKRTLREVGWMTLTPYWLDLSEFPLKPRFTSERGKTPGWAVLEVEALKERVKEDVRRYRGGTA